jgi:DNA-binding MarR family transcriptional regulator
MGRTEPASAMIGDTQLDLSRYLPQMLNRLAARMNERLAEELATIDLPLPHWRILAILNWRGACTLKDIREWTVIDLSTTSRAVKRLEEEGYLTRARETRDRRARRIQLTEAGRARYAEGWRIVSGFHAHVFADVSSAERDRMLELMRGALSRLDQSVWNA